MIEMTTVRGFFPPQMRDNALFDKHMLKEYLQFMVLDFLSSTSYIRKMAFIGGTNLRLIKGIDRFSEDLDFDCKGMELDEFMRMTDDVILFLNRSGMNAQARDKNNSRLTAFRRNIHFPQLLFDLELTGHKEERFLIKIETQDQGVNYTPISVNVRGCGFFFPLPVPSDDVLCAMKLSALFSRKKGRDFYDAMFLLSKTQPDYDFLKARSDIGSLVELKQAVKNTLQMVNLNEKKRDFEHLLFNRNNSDKILRFGEFIDSI